MSDRERHKRVVEKLSSRMIKGLTQSVADKTISDEDADLAAVALLDLKVGLGLSNAFREYLSKNNPGSEYQFDVVLASCMKGTFACGSLIGTSPGRQRSRTKKAREGRTAGRDLHLEAIRYALSQPASHPFRANQRGESAIAKRALKAANQWLRENGHKPDLTEGAIEKRIRRERDNFPTIDSWLK